MASAAAAMIRIAARGIPPRFSIALRLGAIARITTIKTSSKTNNTLAIFCAGLEYRHGNEFLKYGVVHILIYLSCRDMLLDRLQFILWHTQGILGQPITLFW